MKDRALRNGIATSLGLHVLLGIAVAWLGQHAAPALPKPAATEILYVRLAGPKTKVIDAEAGRGVAMPRRGAAKALPPVSAPPPEARPVEPEAPKPTVKPPPEPAPEPTPEADPIASPVAVASRADSSASRADAGSSAGSERGSVDEAGGTSGGGAMGRATGGGGDEENRLARYVEAIRSRIQTYKRYPPLARKRSVEGRVVARVAIRADGRIATIDFESGAQPLLRRATDDAIRGAAPYPAPPDGEITIEFPIDYSLREAS